MLYTKLFTESVKLSIYWAFSEKKYNFQTKGDSKKQGRLMIFTLQKSHKTFSIFPVDFSYVERLVSEQSVVVAEQKRTLTQLEERRENTLTRLDRIQQDILQVPYHSHYTVGVGQTTENGKERHAIVGTFHYNSYTGRSNQISLRLQAVKS